MSGRKNSHNSISDFDFFFNILLACLFFVRSFDVSGSREAFPFCSCCSLAVDDLPSFLVLLFRSTGLMPWNLGLAVRIHYWPAITLTLCDCRPLDIPLPHFCLISRILSIVFVFLRTGEQYLLTTAAPYALVVAVRFLFVHRGQLGRSLRAVMI